MFTERELNTLKALLYAQSEAQGQPLGMYESTFDHALNEYLKNHPNENCSDE